MCVAALGAEILACSSVAATPGTTRSTTAAPSVHATGRIAFQRSGPNGGVYVIDADGTNERHVTGSPASDGPSAQVPRWAPDASVLVVVAIRADGSVRPALVAPDGSGYRELDPDPALNLGAAAWSPDGQWLALEGWDDTNANRGGIYLLHPDGTGLRRLTTGHGIPGAFSPDGRRLVYGLEDSTLHIVDVDTGGDRQLSDRRIGLYPGFLPDGASVFAPIDGKVVVFDLSGRELRTVSPVEPKLNEPRLSSDGERFVFVYDPLVAVSPGVYLMNADGGGATKVVHTNMPGVEEVAPDWAPSSS
jgi:Tol biopolymer transport system component